MPRGIEPKLAEILNTMLSEWTHSGENSRICLRDGERSVRRLCRMLRRSLALIHAYDRQIVGYNRLSNADQWIADQYNVIASASENSHRTLKGIGLPACGELPDLYLFVEAALDFPGFHFTQESVLFLISLFERWRPLTNAEHDFLVPLIHTAAVRLLAASLHGVDQGRDEEAGCAELIERCCQTLFETANLDLRALSEETNQLERELRKDPADAYVRQDERTRALYRYRVAKAAEWLGEDELALARRLLDNARQEERHVGFAIFRCYEKARARRKGRQRYWRRKYFSLLFLVPLAASFLLSGIFGNPLWALLLYLPLYEIFRPVAERLAAAGSEVTYAPRLDFAGIIPDDWQTLVAVSTLLPEGEALESFGRHLEELYLSNPDGAVGYCVLADLKASSRPEAEGDRQAISAAKKMIRELNRRWGDHFVLLVRERAYSRTQRQYTGRERKRGAIADLTGLIRGKPLPLAELCGNTNLLYGTKYLLVLDADTRLTLGSVAQLVSVAAHPMHRPVVDEQRGVVKSGYGIIAPRVAAELRSTMRTRFARAMDGVGGTACYDQSCGEFYQDVWGKAVFTGKGLIDVEVFGELTDELFEEETVLSHDILEGAFLRTLFVGDVQVTDAVPANGIGYFRRLHRWIRGDAQNAQFLLPSVRLFHGRFRNPLDFLDRFHIFDNLRRALTPALSLLCLFGGLFVSGAQRAALIAVAALAVVAPYLYSLWRTLVCGSLTAFFTRFYAAVLPQTMELLLRAGMLLLLLPQFSFTAVDAVIRGFYRRHVSHRKMLEWMTAAQVESGKRGLFGQLCFYAPQWVTGVVLLIFGGLSLKIAGAIFMLAVPLVLWMGRIQKPKQALSSAECERLREDARRMLRFYDDYAVEGEHYLPPDNVQLTPAARTAHRTSPTNIGMMLLSCLTARDLDFVTTDELCTRVARVLDTVEGLDKFRGNLYNWYDTVTLEVLPPGFVSTVDSGNLICSLVALKEGLREYEGEDKRIPALVKRIEALIQGADLSAFYDARRDLFSVGWDSQSCSLSPSHYDMLMSEARMTSYFAVATGQVPARHWRALSRAMSRKGLHAGFVSWTGTMFEYFMPELLLHCVEGSAGYEALRYCVACQRARTRRLRLPWGISESGIYSFDRELNYQYSPNGVQRLARKRGMDDELVVSPYSSYLTLGVDPKGALENLRTLEKMGLCGKYGYYEAVDFTAARIGGAPFELVRSYMAHHVGMSVAAIGNLLCGNRLQKRFLQDARMACAQEFLSEKITVGEFVLKNFLRKRREPSPRKEEEFSYVGHLFPQQPRVKLLSNAELTCVLTDVGASWLRSGRTDITRRPVDLLRNPVGSFCFARVIYDGGGEEVLPLTFAPGYQDCAYETAFADAAVRYTVRTEGFAAKTEVRLHRSIACEQRAVSVQNQGEAGAEITLLFYLEPSLYPHEDDYSHKSFSKLFVTVERDKAARAAVAVRRRRGTEEERVLAVGFREEADFDLLTSREELFERPDVLHPAPAAFTTEESGAGGLPDPCIALRLRLRLERGESRTLTLLTSVGGSRADAVAQLAAVRTDPAIDARSAATARFVSSTLEHRIAQTLLPQLLFRRRDSAAQLNAAAQNRLPPIALWQLGVSADFPIAVCDLYSRKDTERIAAYAACHSLLRLSFVEYDLIFLCEGGAELRETAEKQVREHCPVGVLGARAGIHIIDKATLSPELLCLVYAAACHIATRTLVRIESPAQPYLPMEITPSTPAPFTAEPELTVAGGSFVKEHGYDSFFVTGRPKLPWCHILANPTFGTLLSDRALGFSWAINSRQCKLTPWYNDAMHDNTGERLLLRMGNGERTDCFDLVEGSLPEFQPGYAKYRAVNDSIYSELKVTVPAKGMVKYLDVTLRNDSGEEREAELCYYTEPCLDVTRDHARQIVGERTGDALLLHNPFNHSLHAYMALSAGGAEFTFTCDRPAFLCGRWDGNMPPPMSDPCAALVVRRKLAPGRAETIRFQLAFATTKRGVLALLGLQPRERLRLPNSLRVESGDRAVDVLVNTWLPWQTLASRIYGRTGFYQNGGAYGFRDQLQDVCSILTLAPQLARQHILRCAAVQFEEGDVFHWWHTLPQDGGKKRGVRTRYSDDLLWLPYAVSEYVERTGDASILTVEVAYLTAPELEPGQKDHYMEAVSSHTKGTVYSHCKRAVARAHRLGEHGLPLMGSGDWNDGYSKVGLGGKGESVWLAQFLALVMKRFAPLCRLQGEEELAQNYLRMSDELLTAVEREAWDGRYYLRAFYDDGSRMGSHENDECRIDSLPQSFAVLSGMPDGERLRSAMDAAFDELVDRKRGIIRLFTPAFANGRQDPGYVKAYPAGVRENGGQYTHAAVWFAMAAGRMGRRDHFFCLTDLLNPVKRCMASSAAEEYGLEPYWMAADIYTNPGAYGRGGWSMYTGAAGWYYRLLTEELLGLRLRGNRLLISPCLPERMLPLRAELRVGERRITLMVKRSFSLEEQPRDITLDGGDESVTIG